MINRNTSNMKLQTDVITEDEVSQLLTKCLGHYTTEQL